MTNEQRLQAALGTLGRLESGTDVGERVNHQLVTYLRRRGVRRVRLVGDWGQANGLQLVLNGVVVSPVPETVQAYLGQVSA